MESDLLMACMLLGSRSCAGGSGDQENVEFVHTDNEFFRTICFQPTHAHVTYTRAHTLHWYQDALEVKNSSRSVASDQVQEVAQVERSIDVQLLGGSSAL
jgi:hypothetical protein